MYALTLGRNRPGAGKTLRANPGNVVGRAPLGVGVGIPTTSQRPGQPTDPKRQGIPLGQKSSAVPYPYPRGGRRENHWPGKEPPTLWENYVQKQGGSVGNFGLSSALHRVVQQTALRTSLRSLRNPSGRVGYRSLLPHTVLGG